MATLSLPTLPRWAVTLAVLLWVTLLVVAAWLNTLKEVWATVVADVVGTVAAIAFAATGIAAILTYWQRRLLLREIAGLTAAKLNLADSLVQELVLELLEAQAPVVPSIAAAGPQELAILLRPPLDPEARQLVLQIAVGTRRIDPFERDARSDMTSHAAQVLELVPSLDDLDRKRWVQAQIVAGVLSEYLIDAKEAPQLLDRVQTHWSNAAPIAERLAEAVSDLASLPLDGVRAVTVDAEALVARHRDISAGAGAANKKGATPSRESSMRDVERAINASKWLLTEVVTLSVHLTRVQSDLFEKVKNSSIGDGSRHDARSAMESREQSIATARLNVQVDVPRRILAAWDELLAESAP